MEPERPFRGQVFSVSELSLTIKQMLEGVFADIFVEGEVSNLRKAASGHLYFDLKDKDALLSAVLFKGYGWKYAGELHDGVQVQVLGDVSCYPKQGKYQIIVKAVQAQSKGKLFLEFEKLKAKLQEEGLFDETNKQPIPAFPQRIGVVTSPTGAAVRDILSVLKRRNPNLEIILAPVLVQGEEAKDQIAAAIADLNKLTPAIDVMLVGRGGGSIEDLWAFNEEKVARAIFKSKVPVISCVGHETDFTIADFVADLRAPTPSAAAELVAENVQGTKTYVFQLQRRMLQSLTLFYERAKSRVDRALNARVFKHPEVLLREKQQRVDDGALRLQNAMEARINFFTNKLTLLTHKLKALSPANVLGRGYSITRKADGQIVSRVAQVEENETIYIQVNDGTIRTEVK